MVAVMTRTRLPVSMADTEASPAQRPWLALRTTVPG